MAIKFGSNERKQAAIKKLEISKDEAILLLSLIAEGNVKIKNIQPAYEFVYKVQEFVQTSE